ncbi:MAG: biotin/lipoyl-binding protein [Archaeoglobales archaeon]|nr:biotin/lipoyl-binding protein [Archaeoglobales archaeon]
MKYEVYVLGKKFVVEVEEVTYNVFDVKVNGKRATIEVERVLDSSNFKIDLIEKKEEKEVRRKIITAPMSGIVTKILVKVGEKVEEGSNLAIIEAMKMENTIKSPFSGKVEEIFIKEGDKVSKNDKILSLLI